MICCVDLVLLRPGQRHHQLLMVRAARLDSGDLPIWQVAANLHDLVTREHLRPGSLIVGSPEVNPRERRRLSEGAPRNEGPTPNSSPMMGQNAFRGCASCQ